MGIAKNRPTVVYHYCGLDTFYKIISNSTISVADFMSCHQTALMSCL